MRLSGAIKNISGESRLFRSLIVKSMVRETAKNSKYDREIDKGIANKIKGYVL